MRWYRGDQAVDAAVLDGMNARGWRIYGQMRFSPLYDDLLTGEPGGKPAALRSAFEPVTENCATLGLARLGL